MSLPTMRSLTSKIPTKEIDGFADLLSDKARAIYNTPQTETLIKTAAGYSQVTSLGKPLAVLTDQEEAVGKEKVIPAEYVERLAGAFNLLVDRGAIAHGVMLKAFWMPMVKVDAYSRVLLTIYVYPSDSIVSEAGTRERTLALLDANLGGRGDFTDEGNMGTGAWDHLPRSEKKYHDIPVEP